MREIKFRGRRPNGKWIYGSLIDMDSQLNQRFIFPWTETASTMSCRQLVYAEMEVVDPKTVGQYTRVKDGNGKEIYEGDIIKCLSSYGEDYYTSEITWSEGAFMVDVVGMDYDQTVLGWALDGSIIYNDDIEIIGNIWENPELLKEQER